MLCIVRFVYRTVQYTVSDLSKASQLVVSNIYISFTWMHNIYHLQIWFWSYWVCCGGKVSEKRRQQRIWKDSKEEWSGEESGGLNRREEWNEERRLKRTGVDWAREKNSGGKKKRSEVTRTDGAWVLNQAAGEKAAQYQLYCLLNMSGNRQWCWSSSETDKSRLPLPFYML